MRHGRIWVAAVVAAVLATPASAYYHYVHYSSRNAPFVPQQEKFNLAALPNSTVTFFVNDQGPAVYAPGDSFGSLLGQVKQALAAWDSISTSNLRVAFGGLESGSQASNTPGGDVTFIDLPPGLYGLGGPRSNGTTIADGQVILANNTNFGKGAGPSYLENFYTTAVHEVGHALGLQHTWTASAMSQDVIRNTSRARPFDADDVAAINMLYGKDNWQANYGSISGRVTLNGNGVSLASVVALSPTGPAISSLTNPDGTYQINGLPPNNYLLYVHPLPPDAVPGDQSGLKLPQDQTGQTPASWLNTVFGTQFFPGTTDPQQATPFSISRGSVVTNQNFAVQARTAVPAYDLLTFSFLDAGARVSQYTVSNDPKASVGVTPAFISNSQSSVAIKLRANSGDTPVPQSATVLGGFSTATGPYVVPYPDPATSTRAVWLYLYVPPFAGTGPRHLVLNYGNDLVVMPQAVNLVSKAVPAIGLVAQNGDGSVTINGTSLGGDTRVFFDGLQAEISAPFNGSDQQGSLTVVPPPGTSGQTAGISVFNGDGQNSTMLDPPTAYTYNSGSSAQIGSVSLTSLAGPALAMVDITTQGTTFADGQVTLGFGSDDVSVKRVWILGPNHIQANVSVAPGAALTGSEISLISGFQVMAQPNAFQTLPAVAGRPLVAGFTNGNPGQRTIYSGSAVSLYGQNLTNAQVTLNDGPVLVTFTNATQINFNVPAGFPTGPVVVKVTSGSSSANPLLLQIDVPPPTIVAVTNVSGAPYDATHFASAQDVINVVVSNLDPGAAANPSRVQVALGTLTLPVTISPAGAGLYQLQFVMPRAFGGIPIPLSVVVDGSASTSFMLTVK